MKELINIMKADLEKEGFSKRDIIVYGIIGPSALVGMCVISEIIAAL